MWMIEARRMTYAAKELKAERDELRKENAALTDENSHLSIQCDNQAAQIEALEEDNWPFEWTVATRERERRHTAEAERAELRATLDVTDKLLAERQRVLDAIPPCPQHGECVPHAIEWIADVQSERAELRTVTASVRDKLFNYIATVATADDVDIEWLGQLNELAMELNDALATRPAPAAPGDE
jgi:predicted nuclease with TOPRIM domain